MEQQSALVREYLQLIEDKDLEIARLKRQIEELQGALEALKAVPYSLDSRTACSDGPLR